MNLHSSFLMSLSVSFSLFLNCQVLKAMQNPNFLISKSIKLSLLTPSEKAVIDQWYPSGCPIVYRGTGARVGHWAELKQLLTAPHLKAEGIGLQRLNWSSQTILSIKDFKLCAEGRELKFHKTTLARNLLEKQLK